MTSIVFYFQVHQPYRLRRFTCFDVGQGKEWFDDAENERIVRRVAERCYLPMNELLLERIEETEGAFRCAFSLSGTVLQQLEDWVPEALESFQALAATGAVEFLSETSHHSLAFHHHQDEWARQVEGHRARIERLFGVPPRTFRNTELVLDDDLALRLEELGFDVVLGEGADPLLQGGRSAHDVWRPKGCSRLKLLLRDYVRSDDIAFRFSNREWTEYPLMADTFARWLDEYSEPDDAFVGLFMDYETFGEHQAADTGVIEFMRHLPGFVLESPRLDFRTPAEVADAHEPVGELDIPRPISWADVERDLSAWLGNPMQNSAHEALYALAPRAIAVRDTHPELFAAWRKLTTSDHVYYMCTKQDASGDVHEYFSPYGTPHDAYITFMNVLDDLEGRLEDAEGEDELRPAPRASRAPKPPVDLPG